MNAGGEGIRPLGNVFQGGGGLNLEPLQRLQRARGPVSRWSRELAAAGVLTGHVPLGIRDYLPRRVVRSEPRYLTMLRDPVDRTLSHYFHVRDKRVGEKGPLPPLPPEPTMDDMLELGYLHDNVQTRMLSGVSEPFGDVTDAMLEGAKRSLGEELAFFGITERFDESLVLAKQRLGLLAILGDADARVNANRPRGDDVPQALVHAAERCNRYDIELYRFAWELFDGLPEREGLEFQVELAALRSARGEGNIELGGGEEWRMLLEARTMLLRGDWERARSRASRSPTTAQEKALAGELKTSRSQLERLEQEIERLEAANSKTTYLEQEVERLKAAAAAAAARPKRDAKRRAGRTKTARRRQSGSARKIRSDDD
jgi:hypothetical protein